MGLAVGLGAGGLLSSKKNLRSQGPADIHPYLVSVLDILPVAVHFAIYSFDKNGYIYPVPGSGLLCQGCSGRKRLGFCPHGVDSLAGQSVRDTVVHSTSIPVAASSFQTEA